MGASRTAATDRVRVLNRVRLGLLLTCRSGDGRWTEGLASPPGIPGSRTVQTRHPANTRGMETKAAGSGAGLKREPRTSQVQVLVHFLDHKLQQVGQKEKPPGVQQGPTPILWWVSCSLSPRTWTGPSGDPRSALGGAEPHSWPHALHPIGV